MATETGADADAAESPVIAVVLAGGVGTRLYPASRPDRPKQFRALAGERSLLAATVDRARAVADETYVLTRERYADRAAEHAPDAEILVEPEAKDTGPALVYATHHLREVFDAREREPVVLALPSDHHVGEGFAPVARRACRVARETGGLVTIGVEPTRAATEYGYLKPGTDHGDYRSVERFVEKPDPGAAARYREHGYHWNAGIFAWTPGAFLAAARDSPLAGMVAALDRGAAAEAFTAVEHASVDRAVLERTADVFVVPAAFPWDDLGAWDAIERVREPDGDGNTRLGGEPTGRDDADAGVDGALALDAAGNVLASDDDIHVSVVGVSDLVVAAYDDRVLVVPKRDAQRVREVVDELRERGLYENGGDGGRETD